jgi:hypothetical protein
MTMRTVTAFLAMSVTAAGALAQDVPPPWERGLGQVLGWAVSCNLSKDEEVFVSCGLLRFEGDLKAQVSIGRNVSYRLAKHCERRGVVTTFSREGVMRHEPLDLSAFRRDLEAVALQTNSQGCRTQTIPTQDYYDALKRILMLMRTFPPSPENAPGN